MITLFFNCSVVLHPQYTGEMVYHSPSLNAWAITKQFNYIFGSVTGRILSQDESCSDFCFEISLHEEDEIGFITKTKIDRSILALSKENISMVRLAKQPVLEISFDLDESTKTSLGDWVRPEEIARRDIATPQLF